MNNIRLCKIISVNLFTTVLWVLHLRYLLKYFLILMLENDGVYITYFYMTIRVILALFILFWIPYLIAYIKYRLYDKFKITYESNSIWVDYIYILFIIPWIIMAII